MAARRRVVIWTAVSVGVAAAVLIPPLLWMLVFSPAARLRQADTLLMHYTSAPSQEIAQSLAELVDDESVPHEKCEEILEVLLTPRVKYLGPYTSDKPVTIRLLRPFFPKLGEIWWLEGAIGRWEVDGPDHFAAHDAGGDHVIHLSPLHPDALFGVDIPLDDGGRIPAPLPGEPGAPGFPPGHHEGHLKLTYHLWRYTGGRMRLKPREGETRREFDFSFVVPIEFDVVEPCNADRGE